MTSAPLSRERVVDVARDLMLEQGVQVFSMREVGRRCGVTAPALYRFFESRDALMIAVVERSYDLLLEKLFRALRGDSAAVRLTMVADGYLTFALEHPTDFAILSLLPGAFGLDALPSVLRSREDAVLRFWIDRVREAMDARVLREGSADETALLLLASVHGLLGLHLRERTPELADREALIGLYWRTIGALMEGLAGSAWCRDALPSDERLVARGA